MKKKKANLAESARKSPRPLAVAITALAVLAIAAATVVSRQSAAGRDTNVSKEATTVMAKTDKKNTTVKVAGHDMPVDSQGQIRPLTQDEAQKLAEGLKGMLNKSSEGLVEEQHADGSSTVDLQDRFQSVTVARVNEDGTVTTSCVDNPRAAANFFGIDQKLLQTDRRPTNRPNPQ